METPVKLVKEKAEEKKRKTPFLETLRFHQETAARIKAGLPLTEEQKAQLAQPI